MGKFLRHTSILLLIGCLCACSSNPAFFDTRGKTASFYLPAPQGSPMAELARKRAKNNPGKSGVYPITSAQNALAVRLSAIRAARRSIDIQYFIFRRDETGLLLTQELIAAADRGVRVRFLLDDFTTGDADRVLLMLNRHPNIQIRLFNPFPRRGPKLIELLSDLPNKQRRMHNKSFTVDNSITFIGGRNLSNQYFGFDKELTFGDLDILAIGKIIPPISQQFDLYWNCEFSYPLQAVIRKIPNPQQALEFSQHLAKNSRNLLASDYGISLEQSPVMRALEQDGSLWYWVDAQALYDQPQKIIPTKQDKPFHDSSGLMAKIIRANKQLIVISPYVLPGKEYANALVQAAERGVEIHILTNSLASTDISPVHGAYRKYRKPFLAAGIHLYELPSNLHHKLDNWEQDSKSLLHAKAFVIDRELIYVGSFNMDNRSFQLNTELGLLIESPRLAEEISRNFIGNIRNTAYTLELRNGAIRWHHSDGKIFTREPGANPWQKFNSMLGSWLPIEPFL